MFVILLLWSLLCNFSAHAFYFKNAITSARQYTRDFDLNMVTIAVTRELGANDKLTSLLSNYACVEIPCIMFAPGADNHLLPQALKDHDIVTITSPQGASVLLSAWELSGRPDIKVAAVGKGTSKPLVAQGIKPVYEPTDFTASTLAAELPDKYGYRVLYPASTIAEDTLQIGLQKRGFSVTRLNTYDTVPSVWTEDMLQLAKSVDIVSFASPSAVKVWAERAGTNAIAVVIGPTSARAAESAGFKKIVSPEGSKGLEAWALVIADTARTLQRTKLS